MASSIDVRFFNYLKLSRWLATTHFEPVGARQAFPSFDEPAYKATYKITIIHDSQFNAISNGKVLGEPYTDPNQNITQTVFEETPPMSSYLIAFVVSDFDKTNGTKRRINNQVYAKPHVIQDAQLAQDYGQELLEKLEEFANVQFPFKKMDQIAIPDFSAGAMENWGLVTYR